MTEACVYCSSKKTPFCCELCGAVSCKGCTVRLDFEKNPSLARIPSLVGREIICASCFDAHGAEAQARDRDLESRAKETYFLTKNFRGNVRISRRHTKRVSIEGCADRRDCILRLAYFAAELGFNAIIDAELESKKIVMGRYQSAEWRGSALPATIDGEHLERASLRGF